MTCRCGHPADTHWVGPLGRWCSGGSDCDCTPEHPGLGTYQNTRADYDRCAGCGHFRKDHLRDVVGHDLGCMGSLQAAMTDGERGCPDGCRAFVEADS